MKTIATFFRPVGALVFRHALVLLRPSWVSEVLYWTALDVTLTGFLVYGLGGLSGTGATAVALLANVTFWYVLSRCSIAMCEMIINDLFEANFVATFASPVRVAQWIGATLVLGLLGGLINLTVALLLVWLIFGFTVFTLGSVVVAILPILIMCGYAVGFMVAAVILCIGKKGVMLMYQLIWSIMPLACVYYPIALLPHALQKVAVWVPMAHVFEAVRAHVLYQLPCGQDLMSALWLAAVWCAIGLTIFVGVFVRIKKRGLAQLEVE